MKKSSYDLYESIDPVVDEDGKNSTEERSIVACIKCNMKGLEQGQNDAFVCSGCGAMYTSDDVFSMERILRTSSYYGSQP